MGLIEPPTKEDVAWSLRAASAAGARIGIVGGRTHADRGNPVEVDDELSVARLDRVIAYDPAEMLAAVQAGITVGRLREVLAEGGQEWPSDAPDAATVGGTIAAAVTSPRRLRVGPLRDTVVELELVTGDGRTVRSGARTVKSVQGYDVHRLVTGSLGTLGAIVRVAVKLRPLPRARRLVVGKPGGIEAGLDVLAAIPLPSAVVATPSTVELSLEGWPEEIEEQTDAARGVLGDGEVHEGEPVAGDEAIAAPVVAEVAVAPSKLAAVLDGEDDWRALLGVGIAWVGLPDDGERLATLRRRGRRAPPGAPRGRGGGGRGAPPPPPRGPPPPAPIPALEVQRRLKNAFDPAGILAPGSFWGGL